MWTFLNVKSEVETIKSYQYHELGFSSTTITKSHVRKNYHSLLCFCFFYFIFRDCWIFCYISVEQPAPRPSHTTTTTWTIIKNWHFQSFDLSTIHKLLILRWSARSRAVVGAGSVIKGPRTNGRARNNTEGVVHISWSDMENLVCSRAVWRRGLVTRQFCG